MDSSTGSNPNQRPEASAFAITLWALTAAFATYFCMYAYRRPFTAATFEGDGLWGTAIALKTAFVVSQLIGYTLSKFIGIRVCSEMPARRRILALFGFILVAQGALLLFAVLPLHLKVFAIFINGIPLGMVWGVVVSYLEGRRTSEVMLAGLSASFIVAGGAVRDVGRWTMVELGVSEWWMPFVTGLIFFPFFAVSAWALNSTPPPSVRDVELRSERTEMGAAERLGFVKAFLPGLVMLLVVYFFVTAFRDFRDNYGIEIFTELGLEGETLLFTRTEVSVAFGVMVVLACLSAFRDNRNGLIGAFAVMIAGLLLVASSTWALQAGHIGGMAWMIGIGMGSYLTYVPFGSALFERLMAYTRARGNAVFAIYLCDAFGYTGSISLQLFKDLGHSDASRLDFFMTYTWWTAGIGTVLLVVACLYFLRAGAHLASQDEPFTERKP